MKWRKRQHQHAMTVPGRVNVIVDPDVDALYVKFKIVRGRPLRTVQVSDSPVVMVDYDGDQPVGVEVLW